MRSIVALKELPQGQQPGETLDVPDEHAAVLVNAGAAKYADAKTGESRGGRYRRRDLKPEHTVDLQADEA